MGRGSRSSSKRTRTSSRQNWSKASACGGGSVKGTWSVRAAAQSLQVRMAHSADSSGSQSQVPSTRTSGHSPPSLLTGRRAGCGAASGLSAAQCHFRPSMAFFAVRPRASRQQWRSSATTVPHGFPSAPTISAPMPQAAGPTSIHSSSSASAPACSSPSSANGAEGAGSSSGEVATESGGRPCSSIGDVSDEEYALEEGAVVSPSVEGTAVAAVHPMAAHSNASTPSACQRHFRPSAALRTARPSARRQARRSSATTAPRSWPLAATMWPPTPPALEMRLGPRRSGSTGFSASGPDTSSSARLAVLSMLGNFPEPLPPPAISFVLELRLAASRHCFCIALVLSKSSKTVRHLGDDRKCRRMPRQVS
mmetsp:Transcript_69724/g.204068  ORF Transcript_69724/g.204068 Transcript_69724/m.204068 type:complete len:366 (-) Transcript_69724:38-1135(-)